jgi:hypothetical protein
MAVGKVQSNTWAAPQYYLFEWNGQARARYQDYTNAVNLPRYLADPAPVAATPDVSRDDCVRESNDKPEFDVSNFVSPQ